MRIVFIPADPHLFETEEYIGEGQQAQLDIAIDNEAKRGKLPLPVPHRKSVV